MVWSTGDDKLHREGDFPALIENTGCVVFFCNGKLHREGDKPAIIWPDGTVFHYKNGERYVP